MQRRLMAAALASLSAGAGWTALRPEAAPSQGPAAAARPVWSPERVPALVAEASGTVQLGGAVDAALGAFPPEGTCLTAYEGDRLVMSRRAEKALTPASTQKLLVAAAALERLGGDHRYVTRVVAARPPTDGTVADLWIVGAGDPFLATPEYVTAVAERPRTAQRPLTRLAGLAEGLAEAGVTRVTGTITGDDSRYDRARTVPSWKPSYTTGNQVGPLGALVVDGGFVELTPLTRADDPAVHAAAELDRLLAAAGVVTSTAVGAGTAPKGAVTVAEVRSAPLAEVLAAMVAESDNTAAELILREVGFEAGEGSTAAGAAAVAATLDRLGLPTGGLVLRDGSGLDVSNKATCGLLVATLREVPALGDMLAVAGRSGTLALRFVDTTLAGRLAAKTGSLRGVTGITGFVEGRRRLSFALLANGPFSYADAHALQARVALLLAGYPAPAPG